MIEGNTITYLQSLPGGLWSSVQKKNRLHDLVLQCAQEFPDTPLLSVELGIFGGPSLFCMAMAHKELNNGFAIGIDSWNNTDPLEGTNPKENSEWWGKLDQKSIYSLFKLATTYEKWNDFNQHLVGRTDAFMEAFRDESVTLLHQDSNHASEVIIHELELWAPKIKMGGYWVCDDIDWPCTKDGYAKLPEYGFELMEQFDTWAVWKKVGSYKINIQSKDSEPYKVTANVRILTYGEGIDLQKHHDNLKIYEGIEFCNKKAKPIFDKIMPILLMLPDTREWLGRFSNGNQHLFENNIYPFIVPGVHAGKWGIKGTRFYLRDTWGRIKHANDGKMPDAPPEELINPYYMGDGKVGGYLSHYILYNVMAAMNYDYFMVLEDDCRFEDGWRDKLERALKDVPADFDFLFVGSSDAANKEPVNIKGDVWHFPHREGKPDFYPQTGFCYIVAKKALPVLLATQRDPSDPVDVSLIYKAFPYLNIYAILPRLANQGDKTILNP